MNDHKKDKKLIQCYIIGCKEAFNFKQFSFDEYTLVDFYKINLDLSTKLFMVSYVNTEKMFDWYFCLRLK